MDTPIEESNNIYLDACATSPPHNEVIKVMHHINESVWGNPSSIHQHGIKAAEVFK